MESNQDFEKHIKDSLSNLDMEPKLEVWNKIEQTLDSKMERKVFPFKIISLGVLTLFLMFLIYNYTSENNRINTDTEVDKSNVKNSRSHLKGNSTKSNSDTKNNRFQKDLSTDEGLNATPKNSFVENSNHSNENNVDKQAQASKKVLVKNKKKRKVITKKGNQVANSKALANANDSAADEQSTKSKRSNLDFYTYQKEHSTNEKTT